MGTKEKLIARFLSKPKDFTYSELKRLLGFYSYSEEQAPGSRVVFVNKENGHKIKLDLEEAREDKQEILIRIRKNAPQHAT